MSEIKCSVCCDTGYYGDNGPGIRGNREFVECDQCCTPRPKQIEDPFVTIDKLRSGLEAAKAENAILNRMVEAIAARVKHLRPNSLEWLSSAETIAYYRAEAEKETTGNDEL